MTDLPAAVPPTLVQTRLALHRVAEDVISPVRKHATGHIGLRATKRGFGAPPFGNDDQIRIRVEGVELVVDEAGTERRGPLTTTAGLARLVGPTLLPEPKASDELLHVDRAAAALLAAWYEFGNAVLEDILELAPSDLEPSEIQLWPEHFDIAVDLGAAASGRRATYGFSPGDANHDEPYAYVVPWTAPAPGPLWEATGFAGAELAYGEIVAAPDPHAAARNFLLARLTALHA